MDYCCIFWRKTKSVKIQFYVRGAIWNDTDPYTPEPEGGKLWYGDCLEMVFGKHTNRQKEKF